jgi:hypothetical protein
MSARTVVRTQDAYKIWHRNIFIANSDPLYRGARQPIIKNGAVFLLHPALANRIADGDAVLDIENI